jgi:hypothetical protein
MASSHRDQMLLVLTMMGAAFGLGSTTMACTPASPDSSAGTGAASPGAGGSSGSAGMTAAAGSSGSGGPTAAAGSTGGSSGSGGSVGSSGSTSTGSSGASTGPGSGSGGSPTTDDAGTSTAGSSSGSMASGSSSSGGSGGTNGQDGGVTTQAPDGSVASGGDGGCNWIQNADGTSSFDPASPDKVVLFDGTSLSNWHKENEPTTPIQWTLNADGTMTVVPSGTGVATLIQSNQKFDDLCVHVEYMTPMYPSSVTGQQRGNSGVYLKSAYEMQILDSYGDAPDINTCGAVYSIMKPLVVACHMELVWNTYEIEFKSSVWNTATPPVKTQNAEFIKAALNGQIVQQDVPLNPAAGYTPAGIPDAPGPQPLGLQDHLCYVEFRNIWVRVPQY